MEKYLSLYIDKWYIVGAVIDGANKYPLSLSNAEDRIWLYFFSNSKSNAVNYSLSYKDEVLDGKKDYYGDIFDILPDYKEYHYEKYGARKEMKDIFADAGIMTDLKKAFAGVSDVPVYLSFSPDIDIVSQQLFIKALEDNKFKVLQYTLPVEVLALEHINRRGTKIPKDKKALVVNACNENLRYSIYFNNNQQELVSQRCEPGYGVDCRKQAIVEEVLEYIQADTHFLTGDAEEMRDESLYLSQFAEDWLKKLDNSPLHAPVALGNVHFKKQAQNEVPVVVYSDNINDRTRNIIEKLTGKIVEMIKKENILLTEISHLVFIGDVFTNSSFVSSLQQKVGIGQDRIVKFSELSLPEVVSMYTLWDSTAFEKDKTDAMEAARKKHIQDRQTTVELKTRDLKDKATVAEEEGRLQDAVGIYERILSIDPNDEYSLARIPVLKEQIEQAKKDKEKIAELMEKAHQSNLANKHVDVVSMCDEILRLQPDNIKAKQLKEDAEKAIKRQQQLENHIKQMNDMLGEDKFYDARNILQKVDALNLNDARLKDIRKSIEDGISQLEAHVREKISAYDTAYLAHDYQLCVRLCDELLAMGADSKVWSEQKKNAQANLQKEQSFNDNYNLARQARLSRKWVEVIGFAQKGLEIKDDKELREWIQEARDAIRDEETVRVQEEFVTAYANSQWDDVVELYDNNKFLQLKASNSKLYTNAKRFRKVRHQPIGVSDCDEDELRLQEAFLTAYSNSQWDKVIELYDSNKFLQQKASNSKLYTNAKRFRKNSGPQAVVNSTKSQRLKETKGTAEEVEGASLEKTKKKRPSPSRPKLASRPRITDNTETSDANVEKSKSQPAVKPKVNKPTRTSDINNATSQILADKDDVTIKNNIKNIFNKPKR